ncbi:GIY-YIG nuclease family protein [Candidatus Peregrinibacteria bacterium]|nr:MAG: GIY-YIG nuclease family protein [Candidatus Peregrinibacteria bacterium]
MNKCFYVCIASDQRNQFWYLGITQQLKTRISEHRLGFFLNADQKTRFTKVVYFETFASLKTALMREEKLAQMKQSEREEMITKSNPTWRDLSSDLNE